MSDWKIEEPPRDPGDTPTEENIFELVNFVIENDQLVKLANLFGDSRDVGKMMGRMAKLHNIGKENYKAALLKLIPEGDLSVDTLSSFLDNIWEFYLKNLDVDSPKNIERIFKFIMAEIWRFDTRIPKEEL